MAFGQQEARAAVYGASGGRFGTSERGAQRGFLDAEAVKGLVLRLVSWCRRSTLRPAAKRLALIERISLGPKQFVSLVEAEGVRLLIATSADGAPAFYSLKAEANDASPEVAASPRRCADGSCNHTVDSSPQNFRVPLRMPTSVKSSKCSLGSQGRISW
jgi:hypothetical protein